MNEVDEVPNLRDLGGLRTADGRCVAAGRLYRSSHLAGLSAGAAQRLGLATVVDLRGVGERAAAPARGLGAAVRQVHLPIEPGAVARLKALQAGDAEAEEAAVVQLMQGAYRRFVLRQAPVFGGLVRELLRADACPLLFHCTAGKDRTGFAAAVVLLALGVPQAAIEQDFLLSNVHWKPAAGSIGWVTMSRVRVDYLHTAIATMCEGWGSVDAYLQSALGLDAAARAVLRTRLLE